MTMVVLAQVVFRYIFNAPLSWTDEMSRFLMIYMTYLCLPTIYLKNQNIAMTFVTDKIKGSRLYELMMAMTHAIALTLFSIWIYFGWIFYHSGSVSADSLPIPMYAIYIIPPIMLTISCLFAFQKFYISVNRFIFFPKIQNASQIEVTE